jgi:hypothetical protein
MRKVVLPRKGGHVDCTVGIEAISESILIVVHRFRDGGGTDRWAYGKRKISSATPFRQVTDALR